MAVAAPARGQAPAAAASDQTAAPTRSTVLHVPPGEARDGKELRLVAVIDAAWTEVALVVKYRPLGTQATYAEQPFERSSAGGYYASIPAAAVTRPGIEYYIVGQLAAGGEAIHFASSAQPHRVVVAPTRAVRWAHKERQRLGGYVSSVSADVSGQDFGNRHGNDDRYIRGELTWIHRLLGRLYSISLGYGFIEGQTPDAEGAGATSRKQGARFGHAGLQFKLRPAVWLDARTMLGVSRKGFISGASAVLTLGRPWRSNVSLGGELLDELGVSAWVRLQWDTVPPFLMGATIKKTDLPAATLSNGSFIVYDITWPITPRVTVRGSLSFGSRDGPGNFGGGLGTQFAF